MLCDRDHGDCNRELQRSYRIVGKHGLRDVTGNRPSDRLPAGVLLREEPDEEEDEEDEDEDTDDDEGYSE
ncbi:MAG: hypothetical protein WBW53_09290 [Terriglobales bacterium]